MADRRLLGNISIDAETYRVREHIDRFQPSGYIRDFHAISRDVRFLDSRVPFYDGDYGGKRVTFQVNDVWCFVTPYDNRGARNLKELLIEDLTRGFDLTLMRNSGAKRSKAHSAVENGNSIVDLARSMLD